ncbi:hypothetical protein WJX81_001060 [Elliptochloris bilobata]|uniref:Bifunctional inhibitor/plant lipid transfer protein/seed storage helical domain-containing protein n=1 Tax=Elliptochloris bilobata TaxID=381761 RepID=A0AAW1S1X2_9CHLO
MKATACIFALVACLAVAVQAQNFDPNSCPGQGAALKNGACSAFVQYFQDHQDQYNAPDDQFRTLAYNAPSPSAACCAAANQFVGQKCSCDGPTLGNAQQAGLTVNSIIAIGRGSPIRCGGSNPCYSK